MVTSRSVLVGLVMMGLVATPARGNHTTCAAVGACPRFDPQLSVSVPTPYAGAPTSLRVAWNQTDHESAAIAARVYLPASWDFDLQDVRPGETAGGQRAATCADIYDIPANGAAPFKLPRAEALSASVGLKVRNGDARTGLQYGFTTTGASQSLTFRDWDDVEQVAHLCLMFTETSSNAVPAAVQTFLLPIDLRRVDPGDPDAARGGWRIDLDLRSIVFSGWAVETAASILYNQSFQFDRVTKGNWNRSADGDAMPVSVVRVAADPEVSRVLAEFDTCLQGIADHDCRFGDVFTKSVEAEVRITPAPDRRVRPFATITNAGKKIPGAQQQNETGSGIQPEAYTIVVGSRRLAVEWMQPIVSRDLPPVKGYELVIAVPDDQLSRHFDRIITSSAYGEPADSRLPCGSDGLEETCRLDISFPLNGERAILPATGKYSVALVTLYSDGMRSDGRCDDRSSGGVECPPAARPATFIPPGLSFWQLAIWEDAWPDVYVEVQGGAPSSILLIDYARKSAEFFRWGPNTFAACRPPLVPRPPALSDSALPEQARNLLGPVRQQIEEAFDALDLIVQGAYGAVPVSKTVCGTGFAAAKAMEGGGARLAGASNLIQGTAGTGVFEWGTFKPDGSAGTYVVAGWSGAGGPQHAARALVVYYDPHNWTLGDPQAWLHGGSPPCITERCSPTMQVDVFEGTWISP